MQRHLTLGKWFIIGITIILLFYSGCGAQETVLENPLTWPGTTNQCHPWTRWWWMGSAVDEQNLSYLLLQYKQAGIGGVEICPIYGVKGYEEKFSEFLSPEWMKLLEHTLQEGRHLGIGVDLTLGTGWPFGGPMVTKETASSGVILKRYELQDWKFAEPLPKEQLQYLLAVSSDGGRIDITDKVQQGQLNWTAPAGKWTLYAVAVKNPVQKVKRPAPGGEGYVLDPYSVEAMNSYLKVFDQAFDGYQGPMPRAWFHDSFEYYGATWTTDFFKEFKIRRGYDLRDHIEALFGKGPDDIVARVMCDYHETINDLHLAYIGRWTEWCHSRGGLSRNQAHGAPGNLVDIYAAVDIPETEIFRAINEDQIPMMKFSSSSAHLKGKMLASSESFTWLKEHYQTSLADLKTATDFLFLTGVNHIFFHGIPYSPQQTPWPGWQFYASVNFGPGGGIWHDLPAYNAYVTRCQSILQGGKPDNDILLYLPIYDFWQEKEPLHMAFTIHNQDEWLHPSAFYRTAMYLWKKGYTYDAVTDQFVAKASCKDGKIVVNDTDYNVIIVPHCDIMPVATMEKLLSLAKQGATILFQDKIPVDIPGLANTPQRQAALQKILEEIAPPNEGQLSKLARGQLQPAFLEKQIGNGKVLSSDLETLLKQYPIPREPAMDSGIRFERRRNENGHDYFLVNRSQTPFDSWMTLGKPAQSALLMDPLLDNRTGWAALRQKNNSTQVFLQLRPGQSIILRTMSNGMATKAPLWQYTKTAGSPTTIEGTWNVEFINGGPVSPQSYQTNELASWTERDDEEAKRFFGTARYTIRFDAPKENPDDWLLDLGHVCESARVTLNDVSLGTLWSKPFQLHIGDYLRPGENTLEIEVTNLAANRIRDLDRRNVEWKYFYDINLVNINYKPFDASDWTLTESGLLGPVQLFPLNKINPASAVEAAELSEKIKPTLFIIGDSTVHNSQGGIQGWGDVIDNHFDLQKIQVLNFARGGRSSRTFRTERLWDKVLEQLKPGDFVLMQFGHNDSGSLNTGRARGTLKGFGDETQEVTIEATGQKETVHTYGWYMKKYIAETTSKGAIPIVISPVPRNRWDDHGRVYRASNDYGKWAAQAAQSTGTFFIDLNELVARSYEILGTEEVSQQYFLKDQTHTTPAGAKVNAKILVNALELLKGCSLSQYITSSTTKS